MSLSDPDIAFGMVVQACLMPELIYRDVSGVEVWRLTGQGTHIYQVVHSGSDDDLSLGAAAVLLWYDTDPGYRPAQAERVQVWASTQINDHTFVTTVLYDTDLVVE